MSENLPMTTPERLPMSDADVFLYPDFFGPAESDSLFEKLTNEIHWKQEEARFPGGRVPLPRPTAWYGDHGKSYRYSGITVAPEPWMPLLLGIKERGEGAADFKFHTVLLDLYPNARHS